VSYGGGAAATPRQSNPAIVEAWRNDRLVFEDVPLRRVLAELERYRGGSIILADGRLGELTVTAIFDAKRPGNALQRIAETLPIRVMDAAGLVTLVYPR
jgi:transmembrane sensor